MDIKSRDLKVFTFVRETYWDGDCNWDQYTPKESFFSNIIYSEQGVYIETLIQEKIFNKQDYEDLLRVHIKDLEKICLENSIYIIIEEMQSED